MPKKRKVNSKKNNSYYDPRYEKGYSVLRNFSDFERIGTAMQSHDLELSRQIDSEAAKRRMKNAEELQWGQKKQQIRETSNQIIENPFSFGAGQMAKTSIAGARMMNDSLGAIANHEVPGMPEDYGMSDFFADQWNSFFGEMNHLQAEDARGYQARALQDKTLIDAFNKSLDNLDEIEAIDTQLEQLRSIPRDNLTSGQLQSLDNQLNQLIVRKQFLQKEYDSLSDKRKQLLDLAPKTPFGAKFDEMMSGNQLFGSDAWYNIPGRTTALHDEMNDARRFLYGLGAKGQSRQDMRNQLNAALKEYDKLDEGWNQIISENEEQANYYKNKVTSWFKGREEKASTDFFDPDTYLFKMPGIMGGSSSSWMKQLPAMAAGLIAGAASGGMSILPAAATLGTGAGTAFAFNRSAGISENNAEVSLALKEKIKKKSGLTDKDVDDILSGKMTDQAKLRKITENIGGVENLFNEDMAATTWDAAVDAVLQTVPIGSMARVGKFLKGRKAVQKIIENPTLRKIAESKLGERFTSGWNKGFLMGPGAGIAVGGANAIIGTAGEKLGNIAVSRVEGTAFGKLGKKLKTKLENLGKASMMLDETTQHKNTFNKYARGIGGKLIRSAISEGVEEGKQHVNAEAFKNGTTQADLMNTFDIALTDMANGLKMGAYILGIPLDGIGLVNIRDKELLQEIKGGMIGGWGHVGTISVLQETLPYLKQQKANEFVSQLVFADKLESQANFKQYTDWLRNYLWDPSPSRVISTFSNLRQLNEDNKAKDPNGQYAIQPEVIDEAEKKYKQIIGIATDPITKIEAQNAGINVRSWKNPETWKSNKQYHEFVAAKAIALDKIKEIDTNSKDAAAQLEKVINDVKVQFQGKLSQDNIEEILSNLQDEHGENGINGIVSTIEQEQGTDFNITNTIAKLAAYLKYRDQLERGLEAQQYNSRVRRGIKEQLDDLNLKIKILIHQNEGIFKSIGIDVGNGLENRVNINKSIRTLEDVENGLVYNREEHDRLRDAYEEDLKWRYEYDSALRSYYNLVGKHQRIDENGKARDITNEDQDWDPRSDLEHFTTTKGNAKSIIEDIHRMEKEDDDFETLIETVYKNDLKSERRKEQNGWYGQDSQVNPQNVRPVLDGNGNQVRIERHQELNVDDVDRSQAQNLAAAQSQDYLDMNADYQDESMQSTPIDEQGAVRPVIVSNRELGENEFEDDFGYVWEYVDPDTIYKDPLKEAAKPTMSREDLDQHVRNVFAREWRKMTGENLPLTPEGFIEMRKKALLEKASLSSSNPPTASSDEGSGGKPPVPPVVPPSAQINPVEPEKSIQDKVYDSLVERYEQDKQIVLNNKDGYHTTSQDYFIEIDNKVVRVSRVHNIKPQSYVHQDKEEWLKDSVDALKTAKSYDEVEEIVLQALKGSLGYEIPRPALRKGDDVVIVALGMMMDTEEDAYKDIKKWWQDNFSDLLVYFRYLNDNRVKFFNNPTQESKLELNRTLENLAKSFLEYFNTKNQSIRAGNIFDDLSRNFFGSSVWYEKSKTDRGILELFNSINESENRSYVQIFNNDLDRFKKLMKQYSEKYEYYTQKLGWKLFTLPVTWKANFTNIGWVAGQTDMIGVDKNGDLHIIDFKTSKNTFGFNIVPNIDLTRDYENSLRILNKDDFVDGKLNKKARNVLKAIREDSNTKKITLQWNDSLNKAVVVSKSFPFFETPNSGYGQIMSAYLDYSNQQTAYAEMIHIDTGGNVVSTEIFPIHVYYDKEFRTLDGDIQKRILLRPSKQMLEILSGHVDINDKNLQNLKQDINDKLTHLNKLRSNLLVTITNDVYNILSDNAKIRLSDYLSRIENLQQVDEDDFDLLNSLLQELNDIISDYQDLFDSIKEDYNNQRQAELDRLEQERKREEERQKVQLEENAAPVNIIQADNKSTSFGNTSRTNINYKQRDADESLRLATSAADFITNGTFELYLENDRVFADITYNGKTWKHIEIDTRYNGSIFPNGAKLINDIKLLEQQKQKGQKIIAVRQTMSRTPGRIDLAQDSKGNIVYNNVLQTDLFAGEDIYDVEFTAAYGRIGFIDESDTARVFDGSETNKKTIYNRWNKRNVPKRGTLIYLKHARKDEINRDSIIPVSIDRVNLRDNDINFILQLLQNPNLLDREYIVQQDGVVYNTHATGRQLANMLIPIIDGQQNVNNILSIIRDNQNKNIVYLANKKTNKGSFDLNNPNNVQRLVQELKNLSIAERHNVLLTRMGSDTNQALPFESLRRFFIENPTVPSIKISDSLQFDVDDFKTVTSKKGVKRQGLNGFAYYLKHGLLITQYYRLGSCNVEIRDVMLENPITNLSVESNGTTEVPQLGNGAQIETIVDDADIDALLNKQMTVKDSKKKKLSKERARRHIEEILGKNVPIEFRNTFIEVASCAPHVVGNCKADSIILSSLAWNGVEYHEAFHRIFEMLVPEKKRDKIIEKIAKREGLQLYNEDGSENKDAFRICAEYAADKYMDHMNHHITDIKIPFLTTIFNKIHDWVSMFYHFNDRDLYKIFIEVNAGKYKGKNGETIKPSQKQIDRFNRLYKELYCQIHGVNFENIVNRPMYDKLKQTVVFCIIKGQNVDQSGKNIQEIGKHIDKVTFKAGVDNLMKKGYDIFGEVEGTIPSVGQLAMREIYDNFDKEAIRDDIANAISIISTDYTKVIEEQSIEDAQGDGESVVNANIGEHTRSSYEFSRFSKTSSRVRFFFATIPDAVYGKPIEQVRDGKKIMTMPIKYALNEFGLPQFVPVNTVFNEFLNYFHDVDTVNELLDKLQVLAKEDPMYKILYHAINKIYKTTYVVKDGGLPVVNPNQEALLSQLMNIIRSNRHKFDIAKSKMEETAYGMYSITIQPSDTDYNARFYPKEWNQMLVNGGTLIFKLQKDGSLQFNPQFRGAENAFNAIRELFSHNATLKRAENGATYYDVGIKEWLENYQSADPRQYYLRLKVNGTYGYFNNPKDPGQLEIVKDKITEALNLIGINFNVEELNYMLLHKYGSTDADALSRMFSSTSDKDSMTSFIYFLNNVSTNGTINKEIHLSGKKRKLSDTYVNMAFIKELGNWKYQYRHAHDQLTVLATKNNKFYEISDNNYASDVARFINKRTEEFDEMKSDPYNYFVDEENTNVFGEHPTYGSLIIEEIVNNPDAQITLRNFIGFKTDKRSDQGSDYFEISKREDYVSKATILENGHIIMPTLSDKKTYFYIDGITLPGLNPENLGDQFVIPKDGRTQLDEMLSQNPQVIARFISYAMSEYRSILKADADLDQMEKDGTKSSEVVNFYTKEQGAKFSSLLGVWEYDYATDKDGNVYISGETFHSFNNSKKSRKENIKEAETYFFNRDRQTQERLIARLLHKRFLKEVDTCVELGLIEKIGNSDNIFANYRNVGLNNTAIRAIYNALINKYGEPQYQTQVDAYKSLAVMIYINDISNRAIMSGQETERIFSGNPSFYKWNYDEKTGELVDRTVDELKRLGGVVSTGNNNFLELQDIPEKYIENGKFTGKYICAQVDNELIESPQIFAIHDAMIYGEISTAAYLQEETKRISEFRKYWNDILRVVNSENPVETFERIDRFKDVELKEVLDFYKSTSLDKEEAKIRYEVSDEIDSLTLEELKEKLDPDVLKVAIAKAEQATDSYRLKYKKDGSIDDGIDVADGGAYITDTMAEMLLRMNGNYSSSIQKAFKILREEVTSTILEKQQAYKAVITEVIGSQKYTAFGRRTHSKTGIQVSYYNKMALFPIFRCIATGRMQNIFNKMKQQQIDMLMIDSAVKVGGQGSKPVNWNEFRQTKDESDPINHIDGDINKPLKPVFDESFEFNTYEQKFVYLRKQLNTDPKEEHMMGIGTQMTKIVMANLLDGREYHMQDGTVLRGDMLRQDMMNIINKLSDRGYKKIQKRFFKTNKAGNFIDNDGNEVDVNSNKKVVDVEKFSREMIKLLQDKDPDINILQALEVIEEKVGDKTIKHLRLPLDAISNSKWLESSLISSINKEVVDIKTTGAAFIQRSVWAMEGSAMYEAKNGGIIGDENISPKINNGERLQMINEEGSMDCVVSVDFIKKMLGGQLPTVPIKDKDRNVIWDLVEQRDERGNIKKDKDGKTLYAQKKDKNGKPMFDKNGKPVYKRKIRTREMTFTELRNWLINRKIIGKEATASVVGYRIPTQAESSIHALRIVDILPVVNDTVILPAEFTKITGSDFDIDKLFLSSIQYKVNREEGEDGKFHQNITDKFDEKDDSYYSNKLIRDYIALLLDLGNESKDLTKQRTSNILHRSIDNDTELLKKIIRDLESNIKAKHEEPYGFYSLSAQTESKDDYITGKIGIGPFALNNNNHILTMMYHVRFKHIESSIMSELGLENLDNRQGQDKESIMSWISALINAHVDIAKDPYISRLNVNPFTYNLVNLLIRTGLGDKTFYFTTQPIMKELAKAYINASSLYMADPHSSKYKLQQEAIDKVAESWFKDLEFKFEGRNAMQLIQAVKEGQAKNKDLRKKINEKIKELFDSDVKTSFKNKLNLENQLFYYLAYLQFDKYANALSNLVKYSKIDTKKHGKSVMAQMVYKDGFDRTFDVFRESNLFEESGLMHLKNDSYIDTKTNNAINCVLDILGTQFIQSTPTFRTALSAILQKIGRSGSLSESLVVKVADALSAAIKSKFFTDVYVPRITDNKYYIHDLVSESIEDMNFQVKQVGNTILLNGNKNHNLLSYVNGTISLFYTDVNGNQQVFTTEIVSADNNNNTITIQQNLPIFNGRAILKGGKNTIFDRFFRLSIAIKSNPVFKNLLNNSGEIENRVLQMLVPGKEFSYEGSTVYGERPDTYETMKFVKFFNFVEDSGNTSNYIIDAWEELLSYTNENEQAQNLIRDLARDLIVYGFITSGDKSGFTKIFKYVPVSWREESGYGEYMQQKLIEYSIGDKIDIDLDDVILNNWFDYEMVPTYSLKDENNKDQFISYTTKQNGQPLGFKTVLAALKNVDGQLVASINPEEAPVFIKIFRRKSYDSQRRYTVYKLHSIAQSKNKVEYPVYVKVNPKGNQTSDNFLITEYGRNDSIFPQEYEINEDVLEATYKAANVGQYVENVAKTDKIFASIIDGLSRTYNKEQQRSVENYTGLQTTERTGSLQNNNQTQQSSQNNNFDDSEFSDDAMKHCKS